MKTLLKQIKSCELCVPHLPHGARPVVQASPLSQILIIGQAPGRRVHESGIAWNDPSGDQLRAWLGVDKDRFYDPAVFAFMPMGFCYPGTGQSGDLPPRKECAPQWHQSLRRHLQGVQLTLLIGQYAQQHYLPGKRKNLTECVRSYQQHLPTYWPLPHPSPRNRRWQSNNPWFAEQVLPQLLARVQGIIQH